MIRNALIIHYSFYKNAAVFLVQIWFGIFSGFSGQVFSSLGHVMMTTYVCKRYVIFTPPLSLHILRQSTTIGL